MVNKKVAEALERTHTLRKRWRERERERKKILEEALEAATTKYLASDAFGIFKIDYF